jgi:putative ABC transport system ATP-binding protein
MLTLDSICKDYNSPDGTVQAVSSVSFSVNSGDFVAVQGVSGCGKTTLLLVAGCLLQPSSGTVRLDDLDPYALSPNARGKVRAEKIGFVFQQFHLIPYLSARDNILAPTVARPDPEADARADELIRHFKLEHRVNHHPAQLSTGERQRTALARALLNKPGIIMADEPTGNLDDANAEIIFGYLKEFVAEGGAVLLVTHDPRAAGVAARTLRMDGGKLVG